MFKFSSFLFCLFSVSSNLAWSQLFPLCILFVLCFCFHSGYLWDVVIFQTANLAFQNLILYLHLFILVFVLFKHILHLLKLCYSLLLWVIFVHKLLNFHKKIWYLIVKFLNFWLKQLRMSSFLKPTLAMPRLL
jgi:hypothetical protein